MKLRTSCRGVVAVLAPCQRTTPSSTPPGAGSEPGGGGGPAGYRPRSVPGSPFFARVSTSEVDKWAKKRPPRAARRASADHHRAMTLPRRAGSRPATTPTNPHTQLDQQPTDSTQRELLAATVFGLPGVVERPSRISVPGARALCLAEAAAGPPDAFMVEDEFAHLHPEPDQSLHMMLPPDLATEAIDAGWAEQHPVARRGLIAANAVMVYAPRDDAERAVVEELVRASHAFARGTWSSHG